MTPTLPAYRVDALLAAGGTSDVWLAWSREPTPRPVALKIPRAGADCEPAGWWRSHAELLARCAHPGLLGIDAVLETPTGPAVVLPYVVGGSLADLLDDIATLTPGEVAALVADVADAVAALHAARVVHGDMKAANVLLATTGQALVADARALPIDQSAPAERNAVAGARGAGERPDLRATPDYLAPEVAAGAAPSVAADVFAIGVLAYEALTGVRPHRGSVDEVLAAAAEGAHRPLLNWAHVPPAMTLAVEAALDPDPRVRPDLTTLAADLTAAVPPEELRRPVPTRSLGPVSIDRSRTVAIDTRPRTDASVGRRRPSRRPSRRVILAGGLSACLIVAVAVLGGTPEREGRRSQRHPAVLQTADRPAAAAPATCDRDRAGNWPLGAHAVSIAAARGEVCGYTVQWQAGVLTMTRRDGTRRRYAVGRPGDEVLVGDWDGDGRPGLAVYEPRRGRVLYAERLPVDAVVGAVARAERVETVARNGRSRVVDYQGGGTLDGRSERRVDIVAPSGR